MPQDKKIALMKISHHMLKGMTDYVEAQGFLNLTLQLPGLTNVTGSCEQVSNLFSTDYPNGKTAFLPQSLQLFLELFTPAFKQVYCLVTSYRKELEIDNRHLTSFPLFEIEHVGGLALLIEHISGIVSSAAKNVAVNCAEELQLFGRNSHDLLNIKFEQITYENALSLLNDKYGYNLVFGDDLKSEHEAKIVDHFCCPVFTTFFPKSIKFFSMLDFKSDPRLVESCDLLLPFSGESAGCAARETNIHKICEKLINHSMYRILKESNGTDDKDFDWYLSEHCSSHNTDILKVFRETPELLIAKEPAGHAGAGIGCARVMQWLIGSNNIREAMVYPRNAELL